MRTLDEIELLIRARYPILYLVSAEEERVLEALSAMAARLDKKLFTWSCTTGLQPAGLSPQNNKARQAATRDPLAALDQIVDLVEPALFVLNDFHPHLGRGCAPVVRRLKEVAAHLRSSHKTVVLLSPVVEIPVELEKDVTLLTLPLPCATEFEALLDEIARELQERGEAGVCLEPGERKRLAQAALGLTRTETENVLAKVVVRDRCLDAGHWKEILAEKQQIIRKSGLLEYHEADESFATVGGLDGVKDWLRKRGAALTPEARAFGLPVPRGVLLLGVQGCGKSLCAKATAAQWQLPLLRFDMGRMFSGLVGSSEENIRRALAVAESVAPAVLWMDELDKAFSGARASGQSDGGTTARVLGTFLTWLAEKTSSVFVVATANDISSLPPELLRKGRLDEIFFVDLPGEDERREILAIHLKKCGRDPAAFRVEELAAASAGLSGAEIEQALIDGLFEAFAAGTELTDDHIARALRQTIPLARTMEEEITRLRAWARGRTRAAGRNQDY